jgi:hypothetical protein
MSVLSTEQLEVIRHLAKDLHNMAIGPDVSEKGQFFMEYPLSFIFKD